MGFEETLSWPFFDDGHRRFAETLARWADATLAALPHADLDFFLIGQYVDTGNTLINLRASNCKKHKDKSLK